MMSRAVLLAGGNLGCREDNLARAAELIENSMGQIVACSPVMESEPWGFEADERFLNRAFVVDTALAPVELLEKCKTVERALGREQSGATAGRQRYGSRTMDVDILYYDDLLLDSLQLSVPHPRIAERAFVLRPLATVLPDHRDPRTGLTVCEMLKKFEK
jgi:2-amino-4-hydroxy-6-hydroxymethyldihydropteridine diphosphokinase